MTPTHILKTLMKKLGRNPLAENFPQVEFRLATETSPAEPPSIVASVALSEDALARGNATADADVAFTLTFNTADFSDVESTALIEATDEALCALDAATLNLCAEEIGAPEHFYFFRWKETSVPVPADDGTLSVEFTFRAKVQF